MQSLKISKLLKNVKVATQALLQWPQYVSPTWQKTSNFFFDHAGFLISDLMIRFEMSILTFPRSRDFPPQMFIIWWAQWARLETVVNAKHEPRNRPNHRVRSTMGTNYHHRFSGYHLHWQAILPHALPSTATSLAVYVLLRLVYTRRMRLRFTLIFAANISHHSTDNIVKLFTQMQMQTHSVNGPLDLGTTTISTPFYAH